MSPVPGDAQLLADAALSDLGLGAPDRVLGGVPEEYLPAVYPVTAAAAAAVGASTSAAARLLATRNALETAPSVAVDGRHAAVAFRSERYLEVDGRPASGLWEPLSGDYRTRDGRWFLLHANMPPHRAAALRVLDAQETREAVGMAIARWTGPALEDALAAGGGCGASLRTEAEWARHPQARAVESLALVELEQIGEAEPLGPDAPARPASGVRVLDLTRVIAGPVATRTLAAHGADVLRVGAAHLWDHPTLVIDTGVGKRSTFLDLRTQEDLDRLCALAETADVVVQGYRPGSLAARGLSAARMADRRPGLVVVSISAYGREGPWAGRRGFDSLVQVATGIAAVDDDLSGEVRPLPAQALDHATGYLAAAGAMAALARRRREGGTWHVQVSLLRTARWLAGAGRIDALSVPDPGRQDVADLTEEVGSAFGVVRYVKPPGWIDTAPPRWDLAPSPLGSGEARWLP